MVIFSFSKKFQKEGTYPNGIYRPMISAFSSKHNKMNNMKKVTGK